MKQVLNAPRHQRGTSLLVAMVALVAMMTAGMALIRSVDSANLASSNFQMQQSAEQNIDMALNEALLAYMHAHPMTGLNTGGRNADNSGAAYWAIVQPQSEGVPVALLNLPAPTWGASGPVGSGWPGEQVDASSKQLRRYFIERLCRAGVAGIATAANCQMYTLNYDSDSTSNTGSADSDVLPYIRITVRVDGPKGTVSYAQMFLKGE
jgi:type IV pilus assembly protein PilX